MANDTLPATGDDFVRVIQEDSAVRYARAQLVRALAECAALRAEYEAWVLTVYRPSRESLEWYLALQERERAAAERLVLAHTDAVDATRDVALGLLARSTDAPED